MQQQLSSRSTFFWKFIFPLVWGGGFGLGTLMMFISPMEGTPGKPPPPDEIKYVFLTVWVGAVLFLLLLIAPLKRVRLNDGNLIVSNFFKDTTIPLSSITRVRENRWTHIGGKHPIVIEWTEASPQTQKRKIVFIPTGKAPFAWPWQHKPHPVLTKLQQAVAEAQAQLPESFLPPLAPLPTIIK
jgi:hypothetical protein